MIVVHGLGRLCNVMFQVAAGYALAKKLGTTVAIDENSGDSVKPYFDTVFADIEKTKEQLPRFNEKSFSYADIPLVDDVTLYGYFQSAKYFEGYEEEIKELFKLPTDIQVPESTVGVHFRRGDYLRHPQYHPIPSDEWYREAVEIVGEQNILAFTEPSEERYVTNNFDYKINSQTDLLDLVTLSQCDSVVMSNSSYSWWGTFLGKKKNKVVAPKQWFGPKGPQNWQDVYNKDWIIL